MYKCIQFLFGKVNRKWPDPVYARVAWQEPYQHLCMTLARGIEFRRGSKRPGRPPVPQE